MIKSEAVILAEHEHSTHVSINVNVHSDRTLLFSEIVSILLECYYKADPEITMSAIEEALNKIGEDFIQEGIKNAKK